MEIDEENAKNYIKVSSQSNPKSVAGKIAHSCREGDPPAALCIGASCINQAIKSVCIARSYLEQDQLDITFQPAFRDKDRSRASIAIYIAKQTTRQTPRPQDDLAELTVSAHSKPAVVAGALAARIRESKNVCLTAIGVDAVSNAVLSIGNCRLYLEQNNLDIRSVPEFVTVNKDGRDLNAVRFNIIVESVS